jgi:hypothetical protein
MSCSLIEVYNRFEGTYCLYLQDRIVANKAEYCFLDIICDPEDSDSMFFGNVGKLPEYVINESVTAVRT